MIKVGKRFITWENGMTVSDVIERVGYDFPYYYVTVNATVVPAAQLRSRPVEDGAEVEIHPIVGGG